MLFIIWLIGTIGLSAWVLHEMGRVYGAHVATSTEMRVVALIINGLIVWLLISLVRWVLA